jgi:hypothetical protein
VWLFGFQAERAFIFPIALEPINTAKGDYQGMHGIHR